MGSAAQLKGWRCPRRVLACGSQIVGTRLDITSLPRWRRFGVGVHRPRFDGTRTLRPPKRTITQLMSKYPLTPRRPLERLTEACKAPGCQAPNPESLLRPPRRAATPSTTEPAGVDQVTTYCHYHCRACGCHFTSLKALDAHHQGAGANLNPACSPTNTDSSRRSVSAGSPTWRYRPL